VSETAATAATTPQTPALTLSEARVEHPVRRRGRGGKSILVALDGVSLNVPRGQWVALLGPNGSGKSTMLRLAATLERPTSGHVRVLGADLESGSDLRNPRARLGVAFQEPALDPLLTIRENLRLALALVGLRGAEAGERIERVCEQVGVADRLDDRVERLSGGLARRADLARAIAHEPDLLLLDEPTTGLDVQARRDFLDLLSAICEQTRATILMSTHLVEEADAAERIVLLDRGRIVGEGEPDAMRREMGAHVLRAPGAARSLLEETDVRIIGEGETLIAAGQSAALERAAAALTRGAHAFSYAPPTLEDVFLARTGRAISEDAPPAEAPAQEPIA